MSDQTSISYLPPSTMRPALLRDVQPPGLLLPTGKFGAPFLIVGDPNDPTAVFLDGQYKFQSFKRGTNDHWGGLAIESLQFELRFDAVADDRQFAKPAGSMIRKGELLTMVTIGERPFSRPTEVLVQSGLPVSTDGEETSFLDWRAVITIGQDRFPIWRCTLSDVSNS